MSLAFPEPDLAPIAWIAIAPLLWAARGVGARRGAWLGLVFGLGFFAVLLIWIKYVGWIAWGTLTVLQALFLAAFGAMWGLASKRSPWPVAALVAGATWVLVEYARQELPVLGFTWGQLAQSQHNAGWLLRLAGFTGGWGIAFVVVTVNGWFVGALQARSVRTRVSLVAGAVALLALPAVIPQWSSDPSVPVRRVAIVQGNVPRSFSGTIEEKNIAIINSHARLTRSLAGSDVDLVVWPESSVGLDMKREPVVRKAIVGAARAVATELIVGGNQDAGPGYRVLAYHIAPSGDVIDTYQKTHLVPFGEYVPWRGLVGWIPMLDQVSRDARPGKVAKVFATEHGLVAPVISFEGDFGSLVRERIGATGGRLLVVATNTSTWATSWASAQHLAFSQLRAAENGVFVIHAALSGISAVVDPNGTVLNRTDLWTAETLVDGIEFVDEPTFYARTGDWLVLVCGLVTIGALVVGSRRRTGSVS